MEDQRDSAAVLGAKVREARRERRLTQAQIAQTANVSRAFVVELERGHPRAELGKVLAVLGALGLDLSLGGPSPITVADLAAVVYSAGKVFDSLQTGRLDTEEFLRTGDAVGINSMHDLALLRDLKAAASAVIEHAPFEVTGRFLRRLNASMTQSASIEPGALRRDDEKIGVSTKFGRHEPVAVTEAQLERLVGDAVSIGDPGRAAACLFVAVAKAQPFKDGNKRTGIFAANAHLLHERTGTSLTVPFSETDPTVSQTFNEKLARAYIFGDDEAVIDALLQQGLVSL